MRHAQAFWALGGLTLAGVIAACASVDGDASLKDAKSAPGCSSSGCGAGAGADGGESTKNDARPGAALGGPASDGVLIVHAASFPSFRLCFENQLNLPPQPDSTVMPEANVVGVEQGSIVRIDALTSPPGRVIVVRERDVRPAVGEPQRPCKAFFSVDGKGAIKGSSELDGTTSFLVANELTAPVGVQSAELLVIHGCGTQNTLDTLDGVGVSQASSASCGAGWTAVTGNLAVQPLALQTVPDSPDPRRIPVQLVNVAPAIQALEGTATVSFGEPNKPGEPLDLPATTFTLGAAQTLEVDKADVAIYGARAFNVNVKLKTEMVSASQTLADVQSLSSPTDTPSHYYQAASNYALLLIGDPSHKPKLDGGGDNLAYNPRRALHILAVPVLDPSKVADGGADASEAGTP